MFRKTRNVYFYFGDERCVSPSDLQSNYGLVMRTLFESGVPEGCLVIRMQGEKLDFDAAAEAYEKTLPDTIDILLLSVGEDGHIASLFPHDDALFECRRRVVPVRSPYAPYDRLTITPLLIAKAKKIFVMSLGQSKANIFQRANSMSESIATLPAKIVIDATWLLDQICLD
jgi:6-phosphogluconolactonase